MEGAEIAILRAILIRQATQQAVLRAVLATHQNKAALLEALRLESLLGESKSLHNPQVPDDLREEVKADIAAWIDVLEQG